jgi:hypothetical protein
MSGLRAQFGVRFQQGSSPYKVSDSGRNRCTFASHIDMQSEKFARCQPIFLARLECFLRLANDLELVITKVPSKAVRFESTLRDRLRLLDILSNHQAARAVWWRAGITALITSAKR